MQTDFFKYHHLIFAQNGNNSENFINHELLDVEGILKNTKLQFLSKYGCWQLHFGYFYIELLSPSPLAEQNWHYIIPCQYSI